MVSSIDDARWRAESDAQVLASAKQIMADSSRRSAAQEAARVMAEKGETEAKAMRSVAGGSDPTRKPAQTQLGASGGQQGRISKIGEAMAKVPLTFIKKKGAT